MDVKACVNNLSDPLLQTLFMDTGRITKGSSEVRFDQRYSDRLDVER